MYFRIIDKFYINDIIILQEVSVMKTELNVNEYLDIYMTKDFKAQIVYGSTPMNPLITKIKNYSGEYEYIDFISFFKLLGYDLEEVRIEVVEYFIMNQVYICYCKNSYENKFFMLIDKETETVLEVYENLYDFVASKILIGENDINLEK